MKIFRMISLILTILLAIPIFAQENRGMNTWLNNVLCQSSVRSTHYDCNSYNKPLEFLSLPAGKMNTYQEVKLLQGKWRRNHWDRTHCGTGESST
jgi:hypothetical protein